MEMIRKYGGGSEAQEQMWEIIRDTGGDYGDALAQSFGLYLIMTDMFDGDYVANANGQYVYVSSEPGTLPGGNSIDAADIQKIYEWLGNTETLGALAAWTEYSLKNAYDTSVYQLTDLLEAISEMHGDGTL